MKDGMPFLVALLGIAWVAGAAGTPWDWTGIIGTGQSLSIGAQGDPAKTTEQPYGNLKLDTGNLAWPLDPDDLTLKLVPLVEPIGRQAPGFPSSWPENIRGETPHTSAASEISALVLAASGQNYVSVHSAVGEDGQGMNFLKKDPIRKGLNGHSYEAALIETKAIARLAKAAGKTYGVGAIFITHGESDSGNADYEPELYQLWSDYNKDLKAITGQRQDVIMITSQQNSVVDYSPSTLAQWKVGVDHPATMVCAGPKYQYPYVADGVHLTADGYRLLGEKYGQVFYERAIHGKKWLPLEPIRVEQKGAVITVHFHVPISPLIWDSNFEQPHHSIPEWKEGKGFEVVSQAGVRIAIASAVISDKGNAVILTCASDPGPNARLSYAMVGAKTRREDGTARWGLLRDSDPFVGATTHQPQPNYCVAFSLTVP